LDTGGWDGAARSPLVHINLGLRVCRKGRCKALCKAGLEMEELPIAGAKLLMDGPQEIGVLFAKEPLRAELGV